MLLALRAFTELVGYEITLKRGGFQRVYESVSRTRIAKRVPDPNSVASACAAVNLAASLYWKPVFCLQRAVALTRMLKRAGVPATAVIGYRPSPFISHAWVEVDGKVVNDSPDYQRMRVLDRI